MGSGGIVQTGECRGSATFFAAGILATRSTLPYPMLRRLSGAAEIGSCACFHANTIARVVTPRTGSPFVRLPDFAGPTRLRQVTCACKHASTSASVPAGPGVTLRRHQGREHLESEEIRA